MTKKILTTFALAAIAALAFAAREDIQANDGALPEFAYPYQSDGEFWFNSPPLSVRDLRGKVVLLDFWTFGCYNCINSLPWLKAVENKFAGDNFVVVGIHTPEFSHEKKRERVAEAIEKLQIRHPVVMDNDFIFWKAMRNRYWPTFYVADKSGVVRGVYIGETHSGTGKAAKIESQIAALLKE